MSSRGSLPRKRGRPSKASRMSRGGRMQACVQTAENKENIDIGKELVRWTEFKQQKELATDEEVAKQLLDLWDGTTEVKSDQGLSLSKTTQADFENFMSKTKQSTEDVIRFFLELDVEPGQNAIVVGDANHEVLQSLKSNLSLQADDLMSYLLEVHTKHTKECSHGKECPEYDIAERGKGKIIMKGFGDNESGMDKSEESLINDGDTGSQEIGADQTNKEFNQEATKKRSRKSLPQRVITEQTDFELEGGGKKLKTSDSADDADSLSQYNYIMKAKVPITGPITNLSTENIDLSANPMAAIDLPANTIAAVESLAASMAESLAASVSGVSASMYESMSAKDLEAYGIVKFGQYTVTRDADGFYGCPFCDHKTSVIVRLKRHITMHTGGEYKCPMCDRSYTDKYKLKEHIQVKHEQSVHYSCDLCDKVFTSKGGLRYHRRKIHSMAFDYWCDFCLKGFNQFLSFEVHMSKHKGTMEYKCTVCSKEFPDPATLSTHRQTCVPKKIKVAQLSFDTATNSMKTNTDVKEKVSIDQCNSSWFRCACGTEFKWRAMFDNHRAQCIKSGIQNGTRDVNLGDGTSALSDSIMSKTAALTDGEKSNSHHITEGERLFYEATRDDDSQSNGIILECQQCNYKTSKMSHLKRHELTHNKKKYPCNECSKSFSDPERLKTHQRAKHKGPCKYKCDKCSRTFLSKGGIMYHQQTQHNNSYKYRCETCDKGFNTIQHYLGHKNTHSGVRPFICEKCNVGFAYPSVLSSHKRVCKGKIEGVNMDNRLDLYPCKECKEKFAMFSSLQEHMQEAHGEPGKNRFLCECGSDFELRALYELHKSKCTMPNRSMELILQNLKEEGEEVKNAEGVVKIELDGSDEQNQTLKEKCLEQTVDKECIGQTSQSEKSDALSRKNDNADNEHSKLLSQFTKHESANSDMNKTTGHKSSGQTTNVEGPDIFRSVDYKMGLEDFRQKMGQTTGPESFRQIGHFLGSEGFRQIAQFTGQDGFMHMGQTFGPEGYRQMNEVGFRQNSHIPGDGNFPPLGQNVGGDGWPMTQSVGSEGWHMGHPVGSEGLRQMSQFSGQESFMSVNQPAIGDNYKPINPMVGEGFQQAPPDKFENVASTQPVFPL